MLAMRIGLHCFFCDILRKYWTVAQRYFGLFEPKRLRIVVGAAVVVIVFVAGSSRWSRNGKSRGVGGVGVVF